ncbi:hypothetical protein CGRA01v4_06780 [Colletotrichum graminicola]|nr:hypothetical protein CGRA01v4_06780 [Colletotrichum graminicola]
MQETDAGNKDKRLASARHIKPGDVALDRPQSLSLA